MLFSRKLLLQEQIRFDQQVWDTAGDYNQLFPQGVFLVEEMGGGGAGGAPGHPSASGQYGGAGGGGAEGSVGACQFVLFKPTEISFHVGAKGLTAANGGNGGAGGGGQHGGGNGGSGGGGGQPTFISLPENTLIDYCQWVSPTGDVIYSAADYLYIAGENLTLYSEVPSGSTAIFSEVAPLEADLKSVMTLDGTIYTRNTDWVSTVAAASTVAVLGGGGGGAGGGGGQARNNDDYNPNGGAGGGGGGSYILNDQNVIVSRKGADGAGGGYNGGSTNYDTTERLAGNGGAGGESGDAKIGGGSGGTGYGAGGGGGGCGAGNHSTALGGGGGGGAGGDLFAHGGFGGNVGAIDWSQGGNGWNASSAARPGRNPDGTETTEGYGAGGTENQNGSDGWIRITRLA